MTPEAFNEIIKWVEDAYEIEYTMATKDAWWHLFKKRDHALFRQACEKMRLLPNLFSPHIGKLDEIYSALLADKRQAEDRNKFEQLSSGWLKGSQARIIAEMVKEAWRPSSPVEREAAHLFREMFHYVQGCLKNKTSPKIERSGPFTTALHEIGGSDALAKLQSHEVMVAREMFCKKYVEVADARTSQ